MTNDEGSPTGRLIRGTGPAFHELYGGPVRKVSKPVDVDYAEIEQRLLGHYPDYVIFDEMSYLNLGDWNTYLSSPPGSDWQATIPNADKPVSQARKLSPAERAKRKTKRKAQRAARKKKN